MKIVEVVPIARGIAKETLSYFTAKEVRPGAIVTVPLRSNIVPALVIAAKEVAVTKSDIKDAPFELKKISAIKHESFFLPEFLSACQKSADYFVASLGSVLEVLTPRFILANCLENNRARSNAIPPQKIIPGAAMVSEKLLFQADGEERLATYKSLIREMFAKNASVFFCLPTIESVEHIVEILGRGIEEFAFVFHSKLSKKELVEQWNKALSEPHPIIIIATGAFLSLPRTDVGAIIIEHENTSTYKLEGRPFLDIRTFAEFLADEKGIRLILGDAYLRTETLARRDSLEFTELNPLKFRSLTSAATNVVDIRNIAVDPKTRDLQCVSKDLEHMIGEVRDTNTHAFLLVGRRGLYTSVVCSDCGELVTCKRCSAPMVLHHQIRGARSQDTRNIYLCHKCGLRLESEDRCLTCGGWRLTPLGIGTERVERHIKKMFPSIAVFRLDKDTAPTRLRAQKIIAGFYKEPGSILIGTEMALAFLHTPISHAAVVSVDAFFSLPDFSINEKVFCLLLTLRERTVKQFLVQTRLAGKELFEYVSAGNLLDFYRQELEMRKTFEYPPFKTLIKLTREDTEARVAKDIEYARGLLGPYNPSVYPAFISKIKNHYRVHMLLRVPKNSWPDKTMLELLRLLPPSFEIRVDPEGIL